MLNRTRTSTLDAFGLRDQRNRIYPALTGSDGSTLSLDFTTMSGLDSRFTFTRASTATFINSAGLVQYADSNLVLRSNDFSTNWTPVRSTRTGGQTDPEGGTTAWEITADATASTHRMYQQSISTSQMAASHVTFSVTAKSGTSDYFYIGVGNQNESRVARQIFDLSNGTLGSAFFNGSTNAPTIESATATSLGNGWWRLVVVITAFKYIDSNDNNYAVWIGVTDNSSSPTTAASSGASAYFLRAQLSAGPTERPYYETTTSQYQGPRFDHDPSTLAPRGLLLEGSATNLLWPSNTGFNMYNTQKVGGAGLEPATAATGIDGTQSAVSFTVTQSGGTAPFLDARAGTGPVSSIHTVTANTVYTFSFYWKAGQSFPTNLTRVANGSTSTLITPTSTTDVPGPNGFTRRILVFTTPVGVTSVWCAWAYGTHADGDTYTVTACQLETGSGASSYIPTGAGTVQRAADVCEFPFDPTTYGYSAEPNHTFALGWNIGVAAESGTFPGLFEIRDSGTNRGHGFTTGSGATPNHFSTVGVISGTSITNCTSATTQPIGVNRKLAASVIEGASGHNLSVNGAAATAQSVDPSTVLRTPTRLVTAVTQMPSATLQFVKFYPFAMTSAQLNAITS